MKKFKIQVRIALICLSIGQLVIARDPIIDMAMYSNPIVDIAMDDSLIDRAPSVDYDAENDYEFDENNYIAKDLSLESRQINYQDKQGKSLLMMIAAKEDPKKMMKFVLEQLLANPNLQDRKGQTALHYAVISGNLFLVTMLLQHGAKINMQDYEGQTPLYLAAQGNNVQITNLLLQQGANKKLAVFETGALPIDRAKTSAMRQLFKNN